VARIALVAGAVGSLGLMLRAGTRTPRFLLACFVVWVLSPFAALAWATLASRRWSAPAWTMLHGLTLAVALGSLAFYWGVIPRPPGTAAAFVFVAVPGASWILLALALAAAAAMSRGRG
jgi:hypothetical protein